MLSVLDLVRSAKREAQRAINRGLFKPRPTLGEFWETRFVQNESTNVIYLWIWKYMLSVLDLVRSAKRKTCARSVQ